MKEFICICGEVKKSKSLPRGWKWSGGKPFCPDCFAKRYVLRAVVLPVSAPIGRSWEELDGVMDGLFQLSTDAANWCVHRLFCRDTPGRENTPQEVKPRGETNPTGFYSYGEYGAAFPDYREKWKGATQSLGICLQTAHRKYLQSRWDLMVSRSPHAKKQLRFQCPYPFPVDADAWTTGYAPGEFPVVNVTLPGFGPARLRLRRRGDFRRQLAMFRQFHTGEALKGEASLYRDRKGELLVKLVGFFPRQVGERPRDKVCFLHTDPNALLVAEIDGRKVTITNGDHIRRQVAIDRSRSSCRNDSSDVGEQIVSWSGRHKTFLQRAREDKKREVRMDREQRAQLNGAVEERCGKYDDRIGTAIEQIAAQVVRYCERQGVGLICYDDSVRTFIPDGFAWHKLKTRMRQVFVGEMVGEWIDGEFVSLSLEDRESWLQRTRAVLSAAKKVSRHKSRGPSKSHPAVSTARGHSAGSGRRSSPTS